ncbi:MAG: phage shock protein operon transcriptional activator [Gammaproteobacteria bacterium]|nr:phage shock protein operon transcriptional activator [Gammaproteobacteria bacterium]
MSRDQDRIVGNSIALTEAMEQVSRLAAINRPVLIVGERGTGKELVSERLHYLSPRWDGPLIKVNCAAISEQLLESELFGHEIGAFTGATRTHRGRFERADGGTLFLDELGTMSLGLQEKLLRVIEYGEYERLGGQTTLQADVRVAAATHDDLRALAKQGQFREDLLDRLSFDVVHLPPLRHRLSDIPELAHHFAVQMCAELEWDLFQGFTDAAAMQLLRHRWPGNVRELKNAVERSLHRWGDPNTPVGEVVLDPFVSPYVDMATSDGLDSEDSPGAPASAATAVEIVPLRRDDFATSVANYERRLLQEALQQHNHHQGRTAQALGLSYNQMRGLLRKYQLTGPPRNQRSA